MTIIKLTLTRGCQLQDVELVEEFGFRFYHTIGSVCSGCKHLFSMIYI